jgi:hypothetical protein
MFLFPYGIEVWGSALEKKYLQRIDTFLKPVFHFNRIVAKRSVFLCFLTTRAELMTSTQKKMLRYVTIRLKWKTGFRRAYRYGYTTKSVQIIDVIKERDTSLFEKICSNPDHPLYELLPPIRDKDR